MQTQMAEEVKKSLGRCLHWGDVFETFYRIFLERDPRIPERFVSTDWQEQKKLLRQGVNNVIGFYDGSYTAKHVMERIRHTHGRERLNIPPDLYSHWVESMIEAVRTLDPEFSPTLEQYWREILRSGTNYVVMGYED